MGLLGNVADLLGFQLSAKSLALTSVLGFAAFIVLAIVVNVLQQLLFRNPTEPPMVFHWVPLIGSTIAYGIDPYKFFFKCRAKVCDWVLAPLASLSSNGFT
jgi:hypothetical protein